MPVVIARSLGVLGAFGLMAAFHIYALSPILNREGLTRIGVFFMLNGVATVSEGAIWGHKKHCKWYMGTAMLNSDHLVVVSQDGATILQKTFHLSNS